MRREPQRARERDPASDGQLIDWENSGMYKVR
jgi:hypothetical protein